MNYERKYLKYKRKYLELKNLYGAGKIEKALKAEINMLLQYDILPELMSKGPQIKKINSFPSKRNTLDRDIPLEDRIRKYQIEKDIILEIEEIPAEVDSLDKYETFINELISSKQIPEALSETPEITSSAEESEDETEENIITPENLHLKRELARRNIAKFEKDKINVILPRFHSCNHREILSIPKNVLVVTTSICGLGTNWNINKNKLFFDPEYNYLLIDPLKNKEEIERISGLYLSYHFSDFNGYIGTKEQNNISNIQFSTPSFYPSSKKLKTKYNCSGFITVNSINSKILLDPISNCNTTTKLERPGCFTMEEFERMFYYSDFPKLNSIRDKILPKKFKMHYDINSFVDRFKEKYIRTLTLKNLIDIEQRQKFGIVKDEDEKIIIFILSCRVPCDQNPEGYSLIRQNSLESRVNVISRFNEELRMEDIGSKERVLREINMVRIFILNIRNTKDKKINGEISVLDDILTDNGKLYLILIYFLKSKYNRYIDDRAKLKKMVTSNKRYLYIFNLIRKLLKLELVNEDSISTLDEIPENETDQLIELQIKDSYFNDVLTSFIEEYNPERRAILEDEIQIATLTNIHNHFLRFYK